MRSVFPPRSGSTCGARVRPRSPPPWRRGPSRGVRRPWRRPWRVPSGPASIDDVAHLDLYSCFASSLAFARDALGIGDDRALTVTGGLPYHGGPGSNYDTHALAAMAETLRADPGALGLISGIGMHMTSHSAVVLSTSPRALRPGAPAPTADRPTVPVVTGADGTGTGGHLLHRPLPPGSRVDGAHLRPSRRLALLRPARGSSRRRLRPGRRVGRPGPGAEGLDLARL